MKRRRAVTATAGRWDPLNRRIMFLPGTAPGGATKHYHAELHPYILLAVNEVAENAEDLLDYLCGRPDQTVLLDSGVFWLANGHAKRNGITMDEALGLPPDQLDGWDWLLSEYRRLVAAYGDRLWGYIEVDQGGADNKRRTRAMLEGEGLRPIPVWHPLVDGRDYGYELMEGYDRICLGNIVQADPATRTRLIATAEAMRREVNPDLWIHVLGLHGDELLHAYPMDSCDASTWLQGVRWGAFVTRADMHPMWKMPMSFIYPYAEDKQDERSRDLYYRCASFGAYSVALQQRSWRHHDDEMEGL